MQIRGVAMTKDFNNADNNKDLQNLRPRSFGISHDLIEEVIQHIDDKKFKELETIISSMHSADIADLFKNLDTQRLFTLLENLGNVLKPDVFTYLDYSLREESLELMDSKKFAADLASLESDEAVEILEDLDEEKQQELLSSLTKSKQKVLKENLSYPEHSAGRMMQRNVVKFQTDQTVAAALDKLKTGTDLPKLVNDIFIIDHENKLKGVINLYDLLRSNAKHQLSQVMNLANSVSCNMDREDTANLFRHYGLLSAPVIDNNNKLLGYITVDDMVDVIQEEAEEDLAHMGGVGKANFYDGSFQTAIRRLAGLSATVINTIITVFVITKFMDSLTCVEYAVTFFPVAAALGGSSGFQTITVIIRALSIRDLYLGNIMKTLLKEIKIGLINGLLVSLIFISIAVYSSNISLSIVVGLAILCNVIWSNFCGALLPIVMRKLGWDPAINAGPLLSTIADVSGNIFYLWLIYIFLN